MKPCIGKFVFRPDPDKDPDQRRVEDDLIELGAIKLALGNTEFDTWSSDMQSVLPELEQDQLEAIFNRSKDAVNTPRSTFEGNATNDERVFVVNYDDEVDAANRAADPAFSDQSIEEQRIEQEQIRTSGAPFRASNQNRVRKLEAYGSIMPENHPEQVYGRRNLDSDEAAALGWLETFKNVWSASEDWVRQPAPRLQAEEANDYVSRGLVLRKHLALMADQAILNGDSESKKMFEVRGQDISYRLSKTGTVSGQFSSQFKKTEFLTPKDNTTDKLKDLEKLLEHRLGRARGTIEGIKENIESVNKAHADATGVAIAEDQQVFESVEQLLNEIYKKQPTEKSIQKLESRIKRYVTAPDNTPKDDATIRMLDSLLNVAKETLPNIDKTKPIPRDIKQLIEESIADRATYREVFRGAQEAVAQEIESFMEVSGLPAEDFTQYFSTIMRTGIADADIQTFIAEELRRIEQTLPSIVSENLKKQVELMTDLKTKLTSSLVIPEGQEFSAALQDVETQINRILDDQLKAEKEKVLKRSLGKVQRTSRAKTKVFMDRMIQLTNAGGFSSDKYTEALGDLLGLDLTISDLRKELENDYTQLQLIRDDAVSQGFDGVNGIPYIRKYDAINAKVMKASGIPLTDKLVAVYYANMLSGFNTILGVNPTGTALNLAGDVFAKAMLTRPAQTVRAFQRMVLGGKTGLQDAVSVLSTGTGAVRYARKFGSPSTLEMDVFSGVAKPLNILKYVTRALQAGDTIFYNMGYEFNAYLEAANMLTIDGVSRDAPGFHEMVLERTALDEETRARARALAEREASGGLISDKEVKLRTTELVRTARDKQIQLAADDFASHGTFNYDSKGMLGALSSAARGFGKDHPVSKALVIPFDNIVANVVNHAIDWSPLGIYGAVRNQIHNPADIQLTKEKYVKAATGALSLMAVYGLAAKYADEDDPFFQLTGPGPEDYQKRNEWYASGAKPWSIKIGKHWIEYRNSPFILSLGPVGSVMDGQRYNNEDIDSLGDKLAYMFLSQGNIVLEQSFLQGLSDILKILSSKGTPEERASRARFAIASRVTTATVPAANFFRQAERFFDNTLADDHKDVLLATVKSTPVLNNLLDKKLNSLGDEVRLAKPLINTGVFGVPVQQEDETSTDIYKFVVNRGQAIRTPSEIRTTVISKSDLTAGERRRLNQQEKPPLDADYMSAEQLRAYIIKRGEFIKSAWNDGEFEAISHIKGDEFNTAFRKIIQQSGRKAKRELIGLPAQKPIRALPRLKIQEQNRNDLTNIGQQAIQSNNLDELRQFINNNLALISTEQ